MTDAAAVSQANTTLLQQQQKILTGLQSLDDSIDALGEADLGNAMTQQFLKEFINALRDAIDSSDLPQSMKDIAHATLDTQETRLANEFPSSGEASDAVSESAQCSCIDEAAQSTLQSFIDQIKDALAESNTTVTGTATPVDSTSPSESTAAQTEASTEAANEGTAVSTSPSDEVSDAINDMADAGKAEQNDTNKKGRNWLEALALSLSGIQSTMLNRALKASNDMQDAINDKNIGQDSSEFLDAQTTYTTNMQLFNIFSQQVSTSIKTIGEALAAISRKQ